MCETRFYTDARDTDYLCEVRRHLEARIPRYGGPPLRNPGYPRNADEYPPLQRWTYAPAAETYEQPRYVSRPRVTERWYYVDPGRYREYRRSDYGDDDRRGDYRQDNYRQDNYSQDNYSQDNYSQDDYRSDDYRQDNYSRRRGDDRADTDRRDGYLRYEYR